MIDTQLHHDAMLALGLTYRQLDHWTSCGYLRLVRPSKGQGYPRIWATGEDTIAARMLALVREGMVVEAAHTLVRHRPEVAERVLAAFGSGVGNA